MANNEILPFAGTDTGTNLLTQAEYNADSQRPIGNQPGVARSKLVNKVLRQTSLIASAIAQYFANRQSSDITDSLSAATLAGYMLNAIGGDTQKCSFNAAIAAGTADAITASFTPAVASLANGMSLFVRATATNTSTTPTFTPNSGVVIAKAIVKGNNLALVAGDIAGAGHWLELQYDSTLDCWVLQNPAKGISSSSVLQTVTKLTSGSGTYNTPANCRQLVVRMVGGGGGGGGGGTTGSGYGGVGGNTSFNSVVANGGAAGAPTGGSGGTGGVNGSGTATLRCAGNSGANGFPAWSDGGSPAGGVGGGSVFAGSGGSGAAGIDNTGGGGGGGPSSGAATGGGGGGGEYVELIINNPAASYSYAVGAGGSAGAAGSSGFIAGTGGSGVIVVTETYW